MRIAGPVKVLGGIAVVTMLGMGASGAVPAGFLENQGQIDGRALGRRAMRIAFLLCLLWFAAGRCCFAQTVDDCGWFEEFDGCYFFWSLSGESGYAVDVPSLPDTILHAAVRLIGELGPCTGGCASHSYPCLASWRIEPCPPLDLGCGILSGPYYDDYCWLWTSPVHGRLLTGLNGYESGDTVRVFGQVDRRCTNICMIGDGCLANQIFFPCPDSLSTVRAITWGTLKLLFRE